MCGCRELNDVYRSSTRFFSRERLHELFNDWWLCPLSVGGKPVSSARRSALSRKRIGCASSLFSFENRAVVEFGVYATNIPFQDHHCVFEPKLFARHDGDI